MRLKQLLGSLVLLAATSLLSAAAAVPQMVDVRVRPQAEATTLSIHASGAFTHTEYRPVDNLLLVDLAGVSAGKFEGKSEELKAPGLASYRVTTFKGAQGVEMARVEISLAPGAVVQVSDSPNAVNVRVGTPATAAAPASKPAAPEAKPATAKIEAAPAAKPAPTGTARVQSVSVARGGNGIEIEITASAAIEPKVTRLSGPERLVLDFANATPQNARTISVNSGEVKAVRVGRFQSAPPATRVVVDLLSPMKHELVREGNRVTVRFAATATTQAQAAPAPAVINPVAPKIEPVATPRKSQPKAAPVMLASLAPTSLPASTPARPQPLPVAPAPAPAPASAKAERPAQDFVVVQPTATEPAKPAAEQQRAESAASKFAVPQAEIPLTNVSASMKAEPVPAVNMAMMQQQQMPAAQNTSIQAPQACASSRYTGEPISVNLKDVDLKDFFRLIHEISGLNVVLDPNVRGSLTLVLDDVPWDQALSIVMKNNALECQLEGNVLRIATTDTLRREAEAKRAQIEAQALAVPKVTFTRYLSYAHSKDIVPTIKRFLSSRGEVISDDRTNALIIEDIPSVIPNVDRLIRELDRKTQEVEIEARVVAATRSFARDIGTQLGFGWGNRPAAIGGASSAGQSPIQVGGLQPNYIVTGNNQIPLFTNLPAVGNTSGISFTNATNNYRLDFILTMAETRGLLKILSRPRVVTQNNIKAVVKQGVRIPVVTAAQLGGPPTTTYIEAALRLTVTPQITAEGTIFLDVDVENTTPDFGNQVLNQPTLITQQATTQVLVTDGGTVVIGGVIQTQNSVTTNQVPLLGDIPVLGNLFKRRAVSTSTQELIFFITPKIIQT